MDRKPARKLSRQDWIEAALEALAERGVDGVRVVTLAQTLGATSGSFYWHFKGVPDLLDSLLEYWEKEQTDAIIVAARAMDGPPEGRILGLMLSVIESDAAGLDHTISIWSRRDPTVLERYERTLKKRFDFAAWMFGEAGFPDADARIRGRLMVAYLMGESSTFLKTDPEWREAIRQKFSVLIGGGKERANGEEL